MEDALDEENKDEEANVSKGKNMADEDLTD